MNKNFSIYRIYPVLLMGKTDRFTQFYPTSFTQWVKLTMPTLAVGICHSFSNSFAYCCSVTFNLFDSSSMCMLNLSHHIILSGLSACDRLPSKRHSGLSMLLIKQSRSDSRRLYKPREKQRLPSLCPLSVV